MRPLFLSKRLRGVRVWPVPGFVNHLVFYRATKGNIEVIRILHGARDIRGLLEEA